MHQEDDQSVAHAEEKGVVTMKRGVGSNTPVPSWKLYENPSFKADGEGTRRNFGPSWERTTAMVFHQRQQEGSVPALAADSKGLQSVSVSARKLAASVWEEANHEDEVSPIISVPPSSKKNGLFYYSSSSSSPFSAGVQDLPPSSPRSHLQSRSSSIADSPNSANQHLRGHSHIHRKTSNLTSKSLKTITLMRPIEPSTLHSFSPGQILGDLELSEDVLLQQQHGEAWNCAQFIDQEDSSSLILTLQREIQRAYARVRELESAQKSAQKDVESLLKKCAEEYAVLQKRERRKTQAALFSINEELEKERKVRRNLESENRKLSLQLAEANKAAVQTEIDLDNERKARQLMEDVCDELAREIGQDKARVEELKREHAKAREELEEERRMLQVAEALREERVQMKLSEVRIWLEEECEVLDDLKVELANALNAYKALCSNGHLMETLNRDHGNWLIDTVGEFQKQLRAPLHLGADISGNLLNSFEKTATADMDSVRDAREHTKEGFEWALKTEAYVYPNVHETSDHSQWPNPFPALSAQRRSWTDRKHSSRRRRNPSLTRSHNSRAKGLDALGERNSGAHAWRDQDTAVSVYDNKERPMAGREGVEEFGNGGSLIGAGSSNRWYVNQGVTVRKRNGNGTCSMEISRDRGQDGSEETEDLGTPSAIHRPLDDVIDGIRDCALRARQNECNVDAVNYGHTEMRLKNEVHLKQNNCFEEESALSSGEEGLPCCKQSFRGPAFMASRPFGEQSDIESVAQGKKVFVEGCIDWLKPLRSNSLHAKLLLEDRLENSEYWSRHPEMGGIVNPS